MGDPVLFIDPGSRWAGLALMASASHLRVTRVKGPTPKDAMDWIGFAESVGVTRVVVEDQHAPRPPRPGKKSNFHWPRLKKLVEAAHMWVMAAQLHGMEVERVLASSWQGPMLKPTAKEKDGKKRTTKQRAKEAVCSTWGSVYVLDLDGSAETIPAPKVPQDGCDAALMGRWWWLNGGGR